MTDTTQTTTRACKDCGEMFERWSNANHGGAHSCRCNDCYNAYCRTRRDQRLPVRQCVACGQACGKGCQYCESCGKARRADLERERNKSRDRSGEKPRSWTRACACGVVFTRAGGGDYCTPECPARKPPREPQVTYGPPAPKVKPCERCGVVEILRHANRKRCTECARLHNIERITSLYWVAAANVEVRKAQKWRAEIVAHLRERDGDRCGLCSKVMKFDVPTGPRGDRAGATIDHVIPRSLGGVDDLVNLQLAHWACNNRKGNRGEAQQLRLVG